MNLLTLKERVSAQDRPLAPLPHHNGNRTSTFLPPPQSPTNRQRGATLLFTQVRGIGILGSWSCYRPPTSQPQRKRPSPRPWRSSGCRWVLPVLPALPCCSAAAPCLRS